MDNNYEIVFIILDDCLVHTKSGYTAPRNIADFMPDYNVWYAFKSFPNLKKIVVLSNRNIERDLGSGKKHFIRCSFICEWLKEMVPTNPSVIYTYSLLGNFRPWNLKNDDADIDLIQATPLRYYEKEYRALFIDADNCSLYEYMHDKYPGVDYIPKSEFVRTYNPAPREYTKNRQ